MSLLAKALHRPPFLAAGVTFVVSLATILGAWSFQIFGGYVPCKLCLEQRIPYYVGVPLTLVALVVAWVGSGGGRLARFVLFLAAAVFLIGGGLAVYHAGAEWAWWPGPSDCGGGLTPAGGVDDLMKQLQGIHVVNCTEAAWRLFGLSFAGWNAIVSAFLVVVALWGAFVRRPALSA